MKRGVTLTLLVFLSLYLSFSSVSFTKTEVKGSNGYSVHNLDTGLNYTSIQGAINANETLDRHTILVDAGTYFEQVIINKSLTLRGQNQSLTVLDGSSNLNVVTVIADNVSIHEFTIQNAEGGFYEGCGIHITSDNNMVSQNTIVNNVAHGIWLEECRNNTITHNNISMNKFYGIWIDDCTNSHIYKNGISQNQDSGIIIGSSSGIKVEANDFFSNKYMAIYFAVCDNSIAFSNTAFNNTHGIYLIGSHSILIYNNSITLTPPTIPPSGIGIHTFNCFNCTAIRNHVSNHSVGVVLFHSHNNTVLENHFFNNTRGISLTSDANTTISGNTLITNDLALELVWSNDTLIFHNNFLRNKEDTYFPVVFQTELDNGFEGNYWDNYTGEDPNLDGIGDTAHILDGENTDHYPLMGMFSNFNATSEHYVQTICNSSISEFQHNGTSISFDVTGEDGSAGFCRICIPTALMSEYRILVNGTEVSYDLLPVSNSTHSYLYFTYDHSTKEVVIIPEFTSLVLLPLFMLSTLLATIFYRRKKNKVRT